MKQFTPIAFCSLMLVAGCTSCAEPPLPEPNPVIIPTVEPEPLPDPVVEPEPEPNKIMWKTFSLRTRLMLEDTGQCALFYFSKDSNLPTRHDVLHGKNLSDASKMEQTFEDPNVIKTVNDAFVPVRFPVNTCLTDSQCSLFLTIDLGITKFPSTIIAYMGEDSVTLVGEGYMGAEDYIDYLKTKSAKYEACKVLKGSL